MISYKGLEAKLNERGITRSDLTKELGISSRTIAKIGRGEKLSRVVMEKLCGYFSCTAAELCCEVSDNPILPCGKKKLRRSPAGCTTSCRCG